MSLCHTGKVYPPQESPNASRIEAYIERFKEAFSTELYQWYIEHGELRTMFARHNHTGYMDLFFAEHPHPSISWLYDLGRGRYSLASQALQSEAEHASEIVSMQVGYRVPPRLSRTDIDPIAQLMLSIGKLSHLAQLHEGETSINQDVLDGAFLRSTTVG